MFPDGKPPLDDFISSWYPILIALSFGFIVGLRSYFKGCPNPSIEKLTGKVVLVTGGNRGMGYEVAKDMALRGARIYLGCRDMEKGNEAAKEISTVTSNKDVFAIQLDLESLSSVNEFAENFKKKEKMLHLLVNNAGVMGLPSTKSVDDNNAMFQVNYLAPFLLTHLLSDCLVAAKPSRVINITCHAHRIGAINLEDLNHEKVEEYKTGDMYAQSKLAIVLFTRMMARYMEGSDVTVNAVSPGIVNTGLYDFMPLRSNKFLRWSFFPITFMFLKPAKDGAQTAMYCSVAKEEEGVTGKLYNECRVIPFVEAADDREVAKKLWTATFPLVGIKLVQTDKSDS